MENSVNQNPFKKNGMTDDVGLYTEENFKKYITEKYDLQSEMYIENNSILKMIYAVEWFKIKKNSKFELIKFHPNITNEDYEKLESLKSQHTLDSWISLVFLVLITNKLFSIKLKSRIVWYPLSFAWSSLFFFTITRTIKIFMPDYFLNREILHLSLNKYYTFNINEDQLRKELEEIGIKVKAKYL